MENFVLYHEIYKRDGMTMYKGRKKGTITYVAISCIDKGERIKVTNHVRLVYELEHNHVVKFYEWYETSNHLWLVTELCVGGTLAQVLQQDVQLPESAVRVFGCHLVRGIHHMHGNELVYANWHPSKIILSGDGSLKFFDFSDSRKINEDPKDLMQRFFSTLNLEQNEIDELFASHPVSEYSAPEVLQGNPPGPASDLWGLGCIMYEMFAGSPPFTGEDPQQLTHHILHTPMIVARAHSVSPHLNDLLQRLFVKQPDSRITLPELCAHPFWDGALDDIVGPCQAFVSATPPRTAHGPLSIADDTSTSTIDDVSFTLHLSSRPQDTREVVQTAVDNIEPSSDQQQQLFLSIAMAASKDPVTARGLADDYARMAKDGRLKYDPKLLSVPPYSVAKWKTLRKAEKDKHLRQLETLFKTGEKGPPSQRRLHLLNYLATMAMAQDISNHMIECGLAMELCRQLKGSNNQEWITRVCQALSVMFHQSTFVIGAPEVVVAVYGEVVAILADVLRDQFRCSRVKLSCVAALGEALARLAQTGVELPETVAVGLAVTLINRCLHRTEEVAVSLAAARVVETVSVYAQSPVTRLFATAETAQQLYAGYKHATIDTLKTSAVQGLCQLNRTDPTLFGGLIDRVGPQALLDNLQLGLLAVQEALLEMFLLSALLHGGSSSVRKLTQDGGFLTATMRLLETTSAVVRGKALLLVLLVCQADIGLLRTATDHRLVLYLEREAKRSSATVAATTTAEDRLASVAEQCAALLTTHLATVAVPTVLQDCCAALAAVQGRKHPSAMQQKALRRSLPLLESVASVVSSAHLRPSVLSLPSFCQSLASLLHHCHLVDTGQTILGQDIGPQLLTHTMALVEAACHSAEPGVLVAQLLPPLAVLTKAASSADLRVIGLKLCGDMVHMVDPESEVALAPVVDAVEMSLMPQCRQFFLDPDPSPVYMLRLLRHHLAHLAPDSALRASSVHGLPQLLAQLLIDHQSRVLSATVLESLLLVSAIAQTNGSSSSSNIGGGILRDLILDVDLVPTLCEVVLDIGDHYHKDERGQQAPRTTESLLAGMDALYGLSRLVSDVVRSALQAKRKGESEEMTAKLTAEAEELLTAGKPLTDTVDLLIVTVGTETGPPPDSDVGETATRLLNQVVSLYGGQQIQHGAREANLASLCAAVLSASVKQRRTLLRILKRLLASGPTAETGGGGASIVRDMVAKLAVVCAAEADVASQGILDDIAKCVSVPSK